MADGDFAREEKGLDESKPGPRFLVLMGLFLTGMDAGLLSIEALYASAVSMAYAVALTTATVATMVRGGRGEATPKADLPSTGPTWHESTRFTDPWYQVPAIFCVAILFARFVQDLVAEPPTTDRAMWFLGCLGIAILAGAFGLTGAADATKRRKNEKAHPADEAAKSGEERSAVGAALRDPWFSVPATSIAFLHFAREGLEKIEEDPDSLWATAWLLIAPAILVTSLVRAALARARQRRNEAASLGANGEVRGRTG